MKDKYTIWDEMRRMQEQMDRMVENIGSTDPFHARTRNLLEGPTSKKGEITISNYKHPLSDFYETDKELIAEVEMPGISKKEIQVYVTDNSIELKAQVSSDIKEDDKKKGIYKFERTYTGFYRHFALPSNVDAQKAAAEYKDGILKIIVPKKEGKQQGGKIIDVK